MQRIGETQAMASGHLRKDPTLWAIPVFFASIAAERAWYRRHPGQRDPSGGYETRDTMASLSMGQLSVIAPIVLPTLLRPLTPGRGRFAKALLGVAAASAAAAAGADLGLRRRRRHVDLVGDLAAEGPTLVADSVESPSDRRLRFVQKLAGPVAMATGGVAAATWLASIASSDRMFAKRLLPDLGSGLVPFSLAMIGWDFLYYWSHRLQHEHRYLWSIHVVHHSSERYNLSTALRQPIAESFGTMVPYGVLSLFGIRPSLIMKARGVNLIWQFWIHTEVVRSLGLGEALLSTPSSHRVHHGANARYLDRNHGGILILWDRIFGTFEAEDEQSVYGLTSNIETFNPAIIATHEYRAMFSDISHATSWGDRIRFAIGPPGWRPALASGAEPTLESGIANPGDPRVAA
jgi:hypothetical protein